MIGKAGLRIVVRFAPAVVIAATGVAGLLIASELGHRRASPSPVVAWQAGAGERVRYPPGAAHLRLPDGRQRPIRSLLNIPRPLRYGDFVWNERGIADGPVWIRVDLGLQTISVFRGGDEIGSALILFGADRKPTPTGLYPILRKAKQHRSSLYDAEMPYMLQLTGDGVAIHASSVRFRAATHGCIGVPIGFAQRLFDTVVRGDLVAILPPARAPTA